MRDERALLRGQVWVAEYHDDKLLREVDLGKNVITDLGGLNVARILARTASHSELSGVSFPDDEGVDISTSGGADVLPRKLGIGTGTTVARSSDTGLETPITDGVDPIVYDLARIRVFDTVAEYEGNAPYVAWEFDIPAGAIDTETSPITIREFILLTEDESTCLARKVRPFEKRFETSLVVRWIWRT